MLNITAVWFMKVIVCVVKTVGESVRNVVLRWPQHEDPNKQLEPAKHLKYFPDHQFVWKVLTWAPEYTRKRNFLGAFLIKSINSALNVQLDTELLVLFRNGVTSNIFYWFYLSALQYKIEILKFVHT